MQNDKSIYCSSYDTKRRFCSYWHQVNEIMQLKPASILEVGVGTGFLSSYLRKWNLPVVTLDIDPENRPDIAGDVLNLPLPDDIVELVCCFQVLEHLPYPAFREAIEEIYRVTRSDALISLPDVTRCYRFMLTLPIIGTISRLIEVPQLFPAEHHYDGEHYWEIGTRNHAAGRILDDIVRAGFRITRQYRVFENPYHRIILCRKDRR